MYAERKVLALLVGGFISTSMLLSTACDSDVETATHDDQQQRQSFSRRIAETYEQINVFIMPELRGYANLRTAVEGAVKQLDALNLENARPLRFTIVDHCPGLSDDTIANVRITAADHIHSVDHGLGTPIDHVATAELPSSLGQPALELQVSEYALESGQLPTSQIQQSIMHAMGHVLGLRHNDWALNSSCIGDHPIEPSEDAIHIPSTPEDEDFFSVMNTCFLRLEGGDEFSAHDERALRFLYPDK